jgi:hypothetical protein
MIGPEVRRAFERWRTGQVDGCVGCWGGPATEHTCSPLFYVEAYPLYIGNSMRGTWYMREYALSGRVARVWRLEESESGGFSFVEVRS